MRVGSVGETQRNAYDAYVASRPESLFFHRFAWRDAVVAAYGETPCYLAASSDDGRLSGVLPLFLVSGLFGKKRLLSLPHAPAAGLLANHPEASAALTVEALRLSRELVGGRMIWREPPALDPSPGWAGTATYRLSLPGDIESLWKRLRSELRNRVRKAEKTGVTVAEGRELLPGFYRVYERHMLELGTPPHPPVFFETLADAEPSRVVVSLANLGGKPVAAMIRTRHADVVTAVWVSSLSRAKAACPVNLLYWHALKTSVEQGVAVFDFGRGRSGSGPTIFKIRHGAVPHPLTNHSWPENSSAQEKTDSPLMTLAARVWHRLPTGLTIAMGCRVRRFLP